MLRAYIIRSRIQEADKIMLAQPYSPQLFRQGLLPGPQLLLDVLLKKIDYAGVKKKWADITKSTGQKKTTKWSILQLELNSGGFQIYLSFICEMFMLLPERHSWWKHASKIFDFQKSLIVYSFKKNKDFIFQSHDQHSNRRFGVQTRKTTIYIFHWTRTFTETVLAMSSNSGIYIDSSQAMPFLHRQIRPRGNLQALVAFHSHKKCRQSTKRGLGKRARFGVCYM